MLLFVAVMSIAEAAQYAAHHASRVAFVAARVFALVACACRRSTAATAGSFAHLLLSARVPEQPMSRSVCRAVTRTYVFPTSSDAVKPTLY